MPTSVADSITTYLAQIDNIETKATLVIQAGGVGELPCDDVKDAQHCCD